MLNSDVISELQATSCEQSLKGTNTDSDYELLARQVRVGYS
jgi:hypothetical protein